MDDDLTLEELFTLCEPEDLPPLEQSPAYHPSSLEFLAGLRRKKSDLLKAFILDNGWPDAVRCGEQAEAAAFMIAQHADYDPMFQITCHQLMLASAERGTTTQIGFLAFLTDRILCNQGKRQRFGTQIREAENGCFVPQPLQDADFVDELREAAGLDESLSEYYVRINDGDMMLYRPLVMDDDMPTAEAMREDKVVELFPDAHH